MTKTLGETNTAPPKAIRQSAGNGNYRLSFHPLFSPRPSTEACRTLTNTSFLDIIPRFSAIIPPRRKFAPLRATHQTMKKINHKYHEAVAYAYPPCWRQPGSRRPPPTIPPPTTTTTTSATPPSLRRPTRLSGVETARTQVTAAPALS